MLISAISDTHGRAGWDIPECDVFIHAGDMTAWGSLHETESLVRRLERQLERGLIWDGVILVPGNHDQDCFERLDDIKNLSKDPRIHWLINDAITIEGKKFFGSAYTPPFMDWFFMAAEPELERMYAAMPRELDVLITHGPPYGILDPGYQADHVGSHALLDAVSRRNIRHHVFGHLHSAGGLTRPVAFIDTEWGNITTQFHNVAAVDEAYQLRRGCFEFEI